MKEITLKEIAAELEISITTVSKALKNYQMLVKTKKRLLNWRKLHYTPNSFAVNLRTKESKP
jgi:LacI family transcriptional regulator